MNVFGMPSVCTWALLAPERFDGICSYQVFKSLSIIGQCPMNMDALSPRVGGSFGWIPEKNNTSFSKKYPNDFD
jgi:hypothetical protein